jgi:hypothetical protein
MFCFKKNYQISIKNYTIFSIKKSILNFKKIENFICFTGPFFLFNQSIFRFKIKRYFKLIYKILKLNLFFYINIRKKICNINLFLNNNFYFFKKKPTIFISFSHSDNYNFINECKKYNIPVLYCYF